MPTDAHPAPPKDLGTPDALPLSPMQHAMLVSTLAQPEAGFDVLQVVIRTREGLRAEQVRAAFEQLLRVHPALRMRFEWQGRVSPVAIIEATAPLPFSALAVSPEALEDWLAQQSALPFQMDRAPLSRLALLELGAGEQALVWTVHHAVVDGGSVREVLHHLQALLEGTAAPSPTPGDSGPEVLARHLRRFDTARAQSLWSTAMEGLTAPTRPVLWQGETSSSRLEAHTTLDEASVARLRALADQCQVTLNNVVQAAWGLTLSAYSGEPKVSFGVTRAGRQGEPFADHLVGMFIGTVPLVVTVSSADTVAGLLQQVRDHWRSTREFEHTDPADLHRWSGWSRGAPLFESVMVFDPRQLQSDLREHHAAWAHREVKLLGKSAVPVSLMAAGTDQLQLQLDYDPGCLPPGVAQAMVSCLAHLLEQLPAASARPLSELTFSSAPAEPAADLALPEAPALLERLWHHVEHQPASVAVEHRGQQLSYAQLWVSSRALAEALQGVVPLRPGDAVAVVLERGSPLATAVWALQHLGVAYVPVEPSLAATQLPPVAGNSRVRCVLTTSALASRLPTVTQPVILVEPLLAAAPAAPPSPARVNASAELPAYILYTSGSTGVPKGVEVSQRSLARYVQTAGPLYGAGPGVRWLQLNSLSFDISMEELFVTWGWGGTVVFKPEDQLQSVEQLEQWLTQLSIGAVSPPTALWHEWASRVSDGSVVPPALKLVVIGGEAASTAAFNRWHLSPYRQVRLLNAYGPTEATISVTCFEPARSPADSLGNSLQRLPIGTPLAGVPVRVVGATGQQAPTGAPGELYVGGEQVALGYSDAPELTAASFVDHPVLGRCFKTGDVVCRLPEGTLAFLNRRDRQVKLRGFRVELAGLEAALLRHPAVRQAHFAQVTGAGPSRLLAWVVLSHPVEPATLYAHLRASVPSYALPEAITEVSQLPTNASGKVDLEALPSPRPSTPEPSPLAGPDDDVARGLYEVWARLFPGQVLSPGARLFEDLGVDSLTALLMLAEVQARFGCSLSVGVLVRADTLQSLAEEIRARLGQREVAHRFAVTLRERGTLAPLFLVHGGDGHALAFRELLPQLSPLRPCYAFEAAGFDTAQRPSVGAIAEAYLAELVQLQPRGPVHLAGFCLGGLVALEMAAALRRSGREVAFVGLINTYAPGLPRLHAMPLRVAVAVREREFTGRLRGAVLRRLGLVAPEKEGPLETLLNHAADTWRAHPVELPVHLFRGTADPRWYEPDDLGWGEHCRAGLVVHQRLPIHHVHMLKGPYAVALAAQLESVLQPSPAG